MEIETYDLDGEPVEETELPQVFESEVREDLVRRAFEAHRSNTMDSYGSDPEAGFKTSAESWGAGRGAAMVPRIKNGRRGALVPQAIGGRRAHPPKAKKDFDKKINDNERVAAIASAFAATARPDVVNGRGHAASSSIAVTDDVQELKKTREVREFLKSVDLWSDVERAKEGTRERSGKGKGRGRRKRTPRSLLILVDEDEGISRAARNLPGVDVRTVDEASISDLAPGGDVGRLTVFSESALEVLR